jgi:thiol-disulfide isomerase/thioredoxin
LHPASNDVSAGRRPAAWIALAAAVVAACAYFAVASRRSHVHHEHIERPLAPAFSLVDLSGAPLELARLRGKVVIIDFWATWCGPCRDEAPRLVELQKGLGPDGLQLVGISMDDDAAPVRKFVREHNVNYPVAIGDAALGKRYGTVLGLPVKILVDRDGRMAARHSGAVDTSTLEREVKSLLEES